MSDSVDSMKRVILLAKYRESDPGWTARTQHSRSKCPWCEYDIEFRRKVPIHDTRAFEFRRSDEGCDHLPKPVAIERKEYWNELLWNKVTELANAEYLEDLKKDVWHVLESADLEYEVWGEEIEDYSYFKYWEDLERAEFGTYEEECDSPLHILDTETQFEAPGGDEIDKIVAEIERNASLQAMQAEPTFSTRIPNNPTFQAQHDTSPLDPSTASSSSVPSSNPTTPESPKASLATRPPNTLLALRASVESFVPLDFTTSSAGNGNFLENDDCSHQQATNCNTLPVPETWRPESLDVFVANGNFHENNEQLYRQAFNPNAPIFQGPSNFTEFESRQNFEDNFQIAQFQYPNYDSQVISENWNPNHEFQRTQNFGHGVQQNQFYYPEYTNQVIAEQWHPNQEFLTNQHLQHNVQETQLYYPNYNTQVLPEQWNFNSEFEPTHHPAQFVPENHFPYQDQTTQPIQEPQHTQPPPPQPTAQQLLARHRARHNFHTTLSFFQQRARSRNPPTSWDTIDAEEHDQEAADEFEDITRPAMNMVGE
ncbi:hypothetical protein M7I_2109 [Glarea lozoyensis 74030]|uniref:Uncharacterized protein n=1 Tax=Glarea lozoyensis (strain ATCC 74030 / MF5533) TaxID=1104152 RepID=H0EHW7_GLAL7|nr:hypothetical protein M7I_2109 [Glarea lozoyensis 74030]